MSPSETLGDLLQDWRDRRAPELADAIDRVSLVAAHERPRIESHKEWLAVEKRADPADVPRLLAALTDGVCKDARVRLARVVAWPADPRVALALAGLCDTQPFTSDPNRPFWTPIFPLLAELGDVRVVPRLEAVLADRIGPRNFHRWLADKIAGVLAQLRARRVPSLPATKKKLAATGATLEASAPARRRASGARTEDEMLAAIWAAPDDDEPRAVYADWLQEAGNPRGEFVALQLARARDQLDAAGKKREKELLKKHKKQWLGPLAPAIVGVPQARFERGFVVAVIINLPSTLATQGLAGHAAWATVRQFRMPPRQGADEKALLARLAKLGAERRPFSNEGKFTRGIE